MNDRTLASFLSADEISTVQLGVMQLLGEEIMQYNHMQSSSVKVETAQSLLESMLYSITAYLDTLPEPAAALKTQNLKDLRQKGLDLLKQYIEEAKTLLKEVKATRVQTELIAYNNTIDFAIDKLLQCYDPRFEAQNTTPLSKTAIIDYPLSKDNTSITGILYIKNYLIQLKKENEFCAGYSKNYIRALLLTHGVKHHLDYREMLINIPELILERQGSAVPAVQKEGEPNGSPQQL